MDEPGFGKTSARGEKLPLFRIDGVKLRALPILVAILLGFGLPALAQLIVEVVQHFIPLPDRPANPWMEYYYVGAAQLVLTLIAIAFVKGFVKGDYGLHMPRGDSYVAAAIFWGLVIGAAMTLVDFAPQIAARQAPSGPYELTSLNIAGWLSYRGGFLGITDETLYRGLLVTYLAAMTPGRVSFLRLQMNVAGVIVALILTLPYLGGFIGHPFGIALAAILYTFVQGVFFAYWFEKSKSLLAPVIGHNACYGVYQALIFAMAAVWY
jgi:uncharacterized protein